MKKIIVCMALIVASFQAMALSCGTTGMDGRICTGTMTQFGGTFAPTGTHGGFGGASNCTVTKTPVVFLHGNADSAISFDAPPAAANGYPAPPNSVYAELKAQGYKDCELFGVTYLDSTERDPNGAQYNYHQSHHFNHITNFITAVLTHTGKTKVDIVAHSMGATMGMAALTYNAKWSKVNKFIAIGMAGRGLGSCYWIGYANAYAPTCGSQNIFSTYIFGFWPDGWAGATNPWTGNTATRAFRKAPTTNTAVTFYSIGANKKDQIACTATFNWSTCGDTQLFNTATNVKSQIDVGMGTDAAQYDWDWTDGYPWNQQGGDNDGVGHFRSKNNTGKIINRMLQTTCTGVDCASGSGYTTYGTATAR